MGRGAVVAASLAGPVGNPPFRGGSAAAELPGPVGVAWDDGGDLVFCGPAHGLPWEPDAGRPDRGTLVPGFVDCHVHLPFAG
jgi:cytosine/adenosine deaminase-related metal-dependent hydrolase